MFAWWGTVIRRMRWFVLVAALGFAAFAGVWGTGVFDSMVGESSLDDPGSESELIGPRVAQEVGRQNVDLIALYSSDDLTVTDPRFRDAVVSVTTRTRANPFVEQVTSYYETQAPELVSTDQHATYVAIRLAAGTDDDDTEDLRESLAAEGLTTQVGGPDAIDLDISGQVADDIVRAELIAMPILLVLLVIIFGSLVAASTPLLIGSLAVLGAFTMVRVLTLVIDVSIFAINIITILGLGLAIDYSLFMVSRFREELNRGRQVPDAVARTMATAGRTVAVSGIVVMLALCGLLIFPQLLLRSMGLGGAAAVLVAMAASLTVLPALLAVLGHRIDALRLPWARSTNAWPCRSASCTMVDSAGAKHASASSSLSALRYISPSARST